MTGPFSIEPLSARHNRLTFHSGNLALDGYLQNYAGQDMRRRIANCFVATPDSIIVTGFYTLAAASLPMQELPEPDKRRLPRYPVLPAVLIGRLAVDERFQGRGLGGALLFDASKRAMQAEPAIFALVVDAKGDSAAAFYAHHGFTTFVSRPMSLFLPLTTAAKLL